MEKVNIFWHRRDLRNEDNVGLYYALDTDLPVLPLFIFDKNILNDLRKNDARLTFIHNQVVSLDDSYKRSNSGLKVFYDTPESAFKSLLNDYKINAVFTNRDYEPYAKKRDQQVEDLLKQYGASFYSFKDRVTFEAGEILTDKDDPYKVFTPFKNKWLAKLNASHTQSYQSEHKLSNLVSDNFPTIISLDEMGFERSAIPLPKPDVSKEILENYAEKRDIPFDDATSRIGVHLRFGTISVRRVVALGTKHSATWLSELIWREFYMMILAHYPEVVNQSFRKRYDQINWLNNENQFKRWCEGRTGYPIVDAGMRQLNATGYMHNRVRMVTASFLTKHLLIDWRWGENYFAEKLLDYELASNNGGWQWAAGTGTDAQPYFRVFNPYSQQKKFDKEFKYIKKWIPEYGTSEYPEPIVPHKEARVRAIETYKEALS